MIATATFRAFDGELVKAGERVFDRHEYVRRHPEHFGLAPRGANHRRRMTGQRGRSASGPVSAPPDTTPRVTVFLSDSARRTILEDIDNMEDGGLECGGALIGRTTGDGRITIVAAGCTSDYIERGRTFIMTNARGYEALAQAHGYTGNTWTGAWHSHPGSTRARPSIADKENWSAWRSQLGCDYVGVIALSAEPAPGLIYRDMSLHAWVATAGGIVRASIVETD